MQLATLCYVKYNGKTLLLHRNINKNDIHFDKWNGLGGKFDPGETPDECVTREIWEESGLLISNPILKGVLTFPRFKDEVDWYVFVFIAREFTGELINSSEGKLKWVRDEDIPNLNLWEGDLIFLQWLNEKPFFSGKFEYDKGRLIRHQVVFH